MMDENVPDSVANAMTPIIVEKKAHMRSRFLLQHV